LSILFPIGDYYKNQREKLLALKEGECLNLKDVIPGNLIVLLGMVVSIIF